MELNKSKSQKGIFVIMPFVITPTRDQGQLTSFFENNIRRPIEETSLQIVYKVWRSGKLGLGVGPRQLIDIANKMV